MLELNTLRFQLRFSSLFNPHVKAYFSRERFI